ncbi:hypothetical protein GCM10007063_31790 [Lentibacillus kapialis]|uniref:DUF6036 domain-containing protein n=1 Tax=Lentibacillus kapialis TaxID=340214 RepID=A0A917V0E9_9BACI|nr:DUF6036 family nucleotidyltransferase [Lentibacillus kapialis]GGK06884.1 hypothetical protein GCM10007063_31790 [Lentibacillus kapialis]
MHDVEFRPTNDIDVEIIAAQNMDVFLEGLREANIQTVGGVMEVPPIEDLTSKDNLLKLGDQGFTNISVFVPSLEVLACCKIFSKRQKDLNDLIDTDLLLTCNKKELTKLIDEYNKPHTLNINDPDINIHQLDNIFLEKGI